MKANEANLGLPKVTITRELPGGRPVSDELFQSLLKYVDLVSSNLSGTTRGVGAKSSDKEQLRKVVDELEKCQEFSHLVRTTRESFTGDFHSTSSEQTWRWHMHNFFCQSGCYLDLWRGHRVDINSFLPNYCNSFEEKTCEVIYLAPIELVSFEIDSSVMDFDSFKIR